MYEVGGEGKLFGSRATSTGIYKSKLHDRSRKVGSDFAVRSYADSREDIGHIAVERRSSQSRSTRSSAFVLNRSRHCVV
jgi:hypothetical protein